MGNQPSEEKMKEIRRRLQENRQPLFKLDKAKGYRPANKPLQQNIIQIGQQQQSFAQDRNENIKDKFNDPRKLVTDSLEYPYSTVGLLTFKTQLGSYSYIGTGFLVEKNIVMTCAHNLYSRYKNKRSIELFFWPGRNGVKGNYYRAKNFWYPEQYQKSEDGKQKQFDYGMIELEDPIGLIYGYLGLNFIRKTEGKAELAGFPLQIYDKNGKQVFAEKKMYTDKGQFYKISQSEGRIRYTMGTSGGQSGSPIFWQQNGEYYAFGIHTNGGKGGQNQGVILNNSKKIMFGKWVWGFRQKIDLSEMKLGSEEIREFVISEKQFLEKLKSIKMKWNNIGAQGANYLANANLTNLINLNLRFNNIGPQGAKHLASGNLINLSNLNLWSNYIGAEGVKHLSSGNLTNLTTLDLYQNRIGDEGAKNIASGNLTNLTTLHLNLNNITNEGVRHLASGNLQNLTTLQLRSNYICAEGAKHLASGNLINLINLDIGSNYIGGQGAKYLTSGHLIKLTTLNIRSNYISNQGFKLLVQGNFRDIINLNLQNNKIDPKYCQIEINILKAKVKNIFF